MSDTKAMDPGGLEDLQAELERLRRADGWCRMTIAERDGEIERLRAERDELSEENRSLTIVNAELRFALAGGKE